MEPQPNARMANNRSVSSGGGSDSSGDTLAPTLEDDLASPSVLDPDDRHAEFYSLMNTFVGSGLTNSGQPKFTTSFPTPNSIYDPLYSNNSNTDWPHLLNLSYPQFDSVPLGNNLSDEAPQTLSPNPTLNKFSLESRDSSYGSSSHPSSYRTSSPALSETTFSSVDPAYTHKVDVTANSSEDKNAQIITQWTDAFSLASNRHYRREPQQLPRSIPPAYPHNFNFGTRPSNELVVTQAQDPLTPFPPSMPVEQSQHLQQDPGQVSSIYPTQDTDSGVPNSSNQDSEGESEASWEGETKPTGSKRRRTTAKKSEKKSRGLLKDSYKRLQTECEPLIQRVNPLDSKPARRVILDRATEIVKQHKVLRQHVTTLEGEISHLQTELTGRDTQYHKYHAAIEALKNMTLERDRAVEENKRIRRNIFQMLGPESVFNAASNPAVEEEASLPNISFDNRGC